MSRLLFCVLLVTFGVGVSAKFPPALGSFLADLQTSMGLAKPDFSPTPRSATVDKLIAQGYRYEAGLFHHSLYDDANKKHVIVPYGDRILNWRVAEEQVDLATSRRGDAGGDIPGVSIESSNVSSDDGFWDFIPRQLAVIPLVSSVTFASPCYRRYTAQIISFTDSGATIHVTVDQNEPYKNCRLVKELLSFASSLGYPKVHEVPSETGGGGISKFEVTIVGWEKDEQEYVRKYGMFCSVWPLGATGTVLSILETVGLFEATDDAVLAKRNAEFMSERVNWTMKGRPKEIVQPEADELMSGDMFAILRLDGLDPVIGWGTGGHTGHAAMVLKINGTVNVVESTAANPFGHVYWPPPYGVIITPYEQWMKQAVEANYMVDLCRLEMSRAKAFDEKAAADFFFKVQGSPYGFHNFVFSFVDTIANNLPWPTSPAHFHGLMNLFDKLSDNKTSSMSIYTLMVAGLNHRLNTSCLDMQCINEALLAKDITFSEAAVIPEKDSWRYDGKRSMVCDVFVFEMYKAAGIIDPPLDIEATEQTPKDVYQMKLWEDSNDWFPAACKSAKTFNSSLPYCQLMGDYVLELNDYNKIELYRKMNEKCASNPYYSYARCLPPDSKVVCHC